MPILDNGSVQFARRHVERYYDTDFFPKHFAFEAIWHNWDDVSRLLTSRELQDIPFGGPRAIPWPKPKGGYRVVHQLDPLSTLIYTALVYKVARSIELARVPIENSTACSYRVSLGDASFFDSNTGYARYREQSKALADASTHVLLTDISDFYNQIYVHRVRNAVATADAAHVAIATDIEKILLRWNTTSSKGIPVGPAASIILAEAVLIDVDQFIRDLGVSHTRYVDDFRIYADSEAALRDVLRKLTLYLYNSHRLNLSGAKTQIINRDEFLASELESDYETEKIEIFDEIQEIEDPYTRERQEVLVEDVKGRTDAIVSLQGLLDKVLTRQYLDLSLARAVLRRARHLGVAELIPQVLLNIAKLLPVANDVFLYIDSVVGPMPNDECVAALAVAIASPSAQEPAFRIWCEWLLTRSPRYCENVVLRAYVFNGDNAIAKAALAVIEENVAWVRDHKNRYGELSIPSRLAAILASSILAPDEREPWLRLLRNTAETPLERWMSIAALAGALQRAELDDDIPF